MNVWAKNILVLHGLLASGMLLLNPQTVFADEAAAPKAKSKQTVIKLDPSVPDGVWHSVMVQPPADLPKITIWNKLNPVWWFQNVDDPEPPAWYRPDDKRRTLKWRFRNPLHNFDFYVIGVADKEFVRSGKYPAGNGDPNGGWDVSVVKYKCARLPYLSYSGKRVNFYFGWRNRGNFGIKLNFGEVERKRGVAHQRRMEQSR